MPRVKRTLTQAEIRRLLDQAGLADRITLVAKEVRRITGISPKTLYEWADKGYLDGAVRKRGKNYLFLADRFFDLLFNGPDWPRGKGKPLHGEDDAS